MTKVGIVLLAAGGSSRMGFPKQLIEFQGKKLIQIVAERLLACRCFPTTVILGGHSREILPNLQGYELDILENLDWQSGMATSIRCAVSFVEAHYPDLTHLMFALVDQPFVEAEHYYALVEAAEKEPDKVIAAFYGGQPGAPVILPRKHFPMLMRLTGDQGARAVIRNLPADQLLTIDMPTAMIDWDALGDIR